MTRRYDSSGYHLSFFDSVTGRGQSMATFSLKKEKDVILEKKMYSWGVIWIWDERQEKSKARNENKTEV